MTRIGCRATRGRMAVGLAVAGLMLTTAIRGAPAQSGEAAGPAVPVGRSVGERFPDLRFPALSDGTMTSLSSFRGRKVLLIQFAAW